LTDAIQSEVVLGERVARIGDRVVAVCIDFMGMMPVLIFDVLVVGVWTGQYEDGSVSLTGGPALLAGAISLLLWISYHLIGECYFGGTLGKQIMGIQVRSSTYVEVSPSQSLTRNIFRLLGWAGGCVVGFLVAALTANHQRVGDRFGRTIVFEHNTPRRYALVLGICWFVLSGIGITMFEHAINRHLS
jgi:uncharacterized RDD family membrane protein YckC